MKKYSVENKGEKSYQRAGYTFLPGEKVGPIGLSERQRLRISAVKNLKIEELYDTENLGELPMYELRKVASDKGLDFKSTTKKAELIAKISKAEKEEMEKLKGEVEEVEEADEGDENA